MLAQAQLHCLLATPQTFQELFHLKADILAVPLTGRNLPTIYISPTLHSDFFSNVTSERSSLPIPLKTVSPTSNSTSSNLLYFVFLPIITFQFNLICSTVEYCISSTSRNALPL